MPLSFRFITFFRFTFPSSIKMNIIVIGEQMVSISSKTRMGKPVQMTTTLTLGPMESSNILPVDGWTLSLKWPYRFKGHTAIPHRHNSNTQINTNLSIINCFGHVCMDASVYVNITCYLKSVKVSILHSIFALPSVWLTSSTGMQKKKRTKEGKKDMVNSSDKDILFKGWDRAREGTSLEREEGEGGERWSKRGEREEGGRE